jgi:hypothetical protein
MTKTNNTASQDSMIQTIFTGFGFKHLWKALIVCAGLPSTNPLDIEKSWRVLAEVLTDY